MDGMVPQEYDLNAFASAILLIDPCGHIAYMNDSFALLTGFSQAEILKRDYSFLLVAPRKVQSDTIRSMVDLRRECFLTSYMLKTRTDQRLLVDVHTVPMAGKAGFLFFFIPKISHKGEPLQPEDKTVTLNKHGWIGNSAPMYEVSYLIQTVAPTDATVLIQGETGTGKEIVANIIYRLSARKGELFKAINCAALSENLLENELFGHEKGAYTGAVGRHIGLFETASEGTVFLDEIGEISPGFQAKLLRVLECGEYSRIGSVETRRTNVRIIAATNRNLKQMIRDGRFREDLYYRLSVFPIQIPPLRSRMMDIPLIVDYFVDVFNQKYGRSKTGVSDIALTLLFRYNYPGNVRELKNILEHSYIKSRGTVIHDYDLPEYIRAGIETGKNTAKKQEMDVKIVYLMKKFKGNKTKVAQALSISRKTLYQKLAALDCESHDPT